MRRNEPNLTRRALREVARLRRAEIDREADVARHAAEHDVETLERVEALRTRGVVRPSRGEFRYDRPARHAA
jgi:hypothetical protein